MHRVDQEQLSVWIVDDSRIDAEQARATLVEEHEVRWFADGASMLETFVAETPPPDILLLDLLMPGMDGFEVCRFVRTSGQAGAGVGIIVLTAQRLPAQIAQALEVGANDYLSKPYSPVELRARVAALGRTQRALARARQAEEDLETVLASTPDAIMAVDDQSRVVYANDQAQAIFDDELLGRPLPQLIPVSAEASADHEEYPDIVLGDRLYAPMVQRNPGRGGATVALRDVTRTRAASRRQLDFYSIIAHDLRSPLQAMLLRTDSMKRGQRGPVPPHVLADVQKIETSLRSQLAMINDFLDLARMESKSVELAREILDAGAVLTSTLDELQPLLDANGLERLIELPEEPAKVVGDPARLDQVCVNLIANAIKFTPAGKRVCCRVVASDDEVTFEVQDEGPGIDPAAIPTLFDRFSQAIDRHHQVAGSGLGLMIVREIVEAHGGRVGVRSTLGEGSTFWFRLPRCHAGTAVHQVQADPP